MIWRASTEGIDPPPTRACIIAPQANLHPIPSHCIVGPTRTCCYLRWCYCSSWSKIVRRHPKHCLLAAATTSQFLIISFRPPPLGRTPQTHHATPSHPPLLRRPSCRLDRVSTDLCPLGPDRHSPPLCLYSPPRAATLFGLVKIRRPSKFPPSAVCNHPNLQSPPQSASRHHYPLATLLGFTATTDPRVRPIHHAGANTT